MEGSESRDRWQTFSGAGCGIPGDYNPGSAPVSRAGDGVAALFRRSTDLIRGFKTTSTLSDRRRNALHQDPLN